MRNALIASSAAVLVFVVLWIALVVASDRSGTSAEQLERLRRSSARYRWSFVNASLIAPSLVTLLLVSEQLPGRGRGTLEAPAGAFLAGYLALVSVAYGSQYALLPRLLAYDDRNALAVFFDSPGSFTYLLAMLGYALFGVAACMLAPPLIGVGGVWSWAGWLLLASGVLSIGGFAGYAGRNAVAERLNLLGGILIVPFAVATLIGGVRL